MNHKQFTDFFDLKVQRTVSDNGCLIYKMKNPTGEGVITQCEVLPGIQFFFNDFHMKDGQNQNKLPHPGVIEINHCREGRFECTFCNGDYQYLGAGDLSINRLTNQTVSTLFPMSHYHGISITIDLYQASQTIKGIETITGSLHIDLNEIAERFCRDDTCYILHGKDIIGHIFSELYAITANDKELAKKRMTYVLKCMERNKKITLEEAADILNQEDSDT